MTGVLCVGTPRLHEVVQSQLAPSVHSLLLDVDSRYVSWKSSFFLIYCMHPQAQFYSPSLYQRYNMFNSHFYGEGGEEVCREFLNSRAVAIVVDPPFGGLVRVLARQIRHLWNMAGKGACVLCVCNRVCRWVSFLYIQK